MGFEGRLMGSNTESGISFPDFLEMGAAHKFNTIRLSSHEGLEENLISFLNQPGPGVCEIMMDEDQIQGPKSINRRNADGTIKQTPLEDSFPFLDEAEINDNMSIVNALK
jgi:acetolactate synthase-1/2/3 large subunit